MNLQRYYNSSLHSDVTLAYSGRHLFAHKIILCSQSRWFAKACEGQFLEASSSKIELHDDDPNALEGMFRCFYGLPLRPKVSIGEVKEVKEVATEAAHLSLILGVYILVDKYDAGSLRKQLIRDFETVADAVWKKSQFFAEGFLEDLLQSVYGKLCGGDPLRQRVANRMSRAVSQFHGIDSKRLSGMLEDLPDLAKDVVLEFAAKRPQETLDQFPFHRAARFGDLVECRRQIEDGQDVDSRDRDGETPLHFAAWYGHPEVAQLLIANGADVNATGETYGSTPLQWARQTGNDEIVRMLEAAGDATQP